MASEPGKCGGVHGGARLAIGSLAVGAGTCLSSGPQEDYGPRNGLHSTRGWL